MPLIRRAHHRSMCAQAGPRCKIGLKNGDGTMATIEHSDACNRDGGQVEVPGLPPGVKLVHTLRGHEGGIGRIAWSPDGRLLVSPSADGTIRLWHTDTGESLQTLKAMLAGRSIPASVAFDASGKKWPSL